MLITTDEQLAEFVERASHSEVLAVDTEFMREKTYYPQLCLVQLGTDDEQAVVDAFAVTDPEPLARIFSNRDIVKVFHSCSQDMEVLLRYCGVLPNPLFDTQVAAAYLGERNQIGLGALVDQMMHVSLPKAESLTDWTRRPLDEAQISYAVDDVRYLPQIWRIMARRLEERGRTEWVSSEFERLCDPETYAHDPERAYLHVKRVSSLSRRQLAVAREVAAWRERLASGTNRPKKWILSDELLVEVAKRCPTTPAALQRIRGMSDLSSSDQKAILAACRAGLECPLEQCPLLERHAKPSLDSECVCDLMYAMTRMVSERCGIASAMLASRDDLLGFLEHREASPLSGGWRYEVLGSQLDMLLDGQVGLTVKDGRVELL